MRCFLCGLLLVALLPSGASAWSNKEHILLTRLAARRLVEDPRTPAGMREWLRQCGNLLPSPDDDREFFLHKRMGIFPRGVDGLPYWAVAPDLVALADRTQRKLDPFGVNERRLHFIDLEFFMPGDNQRVYAHDLSHRPRLSDIPRDMTDPRFQQAGMLPFAVEHAYRRLVESLRAGRLDDRPGQFPRDEHAARWAGYLAHYLQDNTQPHHSTEDYRSGSYFEGIDARRAPDVHADMEYRMIDDESADYLELRRELWSALIRALEAARDPVETNDLWQSTVEVALISYTALPMIGQAAQGAYRPSNPNASGIGRWNPSAFFHHRGTYLGREMTVMEMKAHQLAWAVTRVEKAWRRAWDEAHGPARR